MCEVRKYQGDDCQGICEEYEHLLAFLSQQIYPADPVVVFLLSDDGILSDVLNVMKTPDVIVAPIKDVERGFFIWYDICCLRVIYLCIIDVNECRNTGLYIIENMYLGVAFILSEHYALNDAKNISQHY